MLNEIFGISPSNRKNANRQLGQYFGLAAQQIANLQGGSGSGPGGGLYEMGPACNVFCCTGNTFVPDITPGQSANVTLIPDSWVPGNCRIYPTSIAVDVQGYANWSASGVTAGAVPYLAIQDSLGVPAAVFPFNSLKGSAELFLPSPDVSIPLVLGPNTIVGPVGTPVTTFTYAAATGIITAGAAVFVANLGIGTPVRVIDGTGKGQSGFISAVGSTTTCTVTTALGAPAFTGLDATSVIGIDWQPLASYSSTTVMGLENGGGTPFTANAFDNGYQLMGVNGVGAGTVRTILSNTTAGVLTLAQALNTAMNTTSTLVQVTNNNELDGAIDCCVGDKWATLTLGKGLQAAVNLQGGTSPIGSAVRIYVEGFYGP